MGLPPVPAASPLRVSHGWDNTVEYSFDARDPVHRTAVYPEVVTLAELLVCPHWRPFAMSALAADRDRFRAEFQRRLSPTYHDLANTDLQLFAIVRHSSVAQWHDPVPDTYPSIPAEARGADQ